MTLTKEQRAALKRVIAYMDEMYAIASPYHGCTEDVDLLRAMIDSSEHFTGDSKMIGFDLEKARAEVSTASARRFSESREQARIFCAEEILPDALDEIERLRGEMENYGDDYVCQMKSKDARIQELEDALAEERAKVIMLIEKLQLVANDPDWQSKGLKHDFDWYLAESKKEIESGEPEDQRCRRLEEPNWGTDPEGKIGRGDA